MIHALARPRFERNAAGDDRAFRRADRKEHRLLDGGWPQVRGEGLSVDDHVDSVIRVLANDLDALRTGKRRNGNDRQHRERRPRWRACWLYSRQLLSASGSRLETHGHGARRITFRQSVTGRMTGTSSWMSPRAARYAHPAIRNTDDVASGVLQNLSHGQGNQHAANGPRHATDADDRRDSALGKHIR